MTGGQALVGRRAIDGLGIFGAVLLVTDDQIAPLLVGERADARHRRPSERTLHDRRLALVVQKGDERLADFQLQDRSFGVDSRVLPERLGGSAYGLLLPRRERAQRMLDAVAELSRDTVWHVAGTLRDVVDADAL